MDHKNNHAAYARIITPLCAGVLGFILVAGLWPFRRPLNDVRWLDHGNGLRFGRRGNAVSLGAFPARNSSDDFSSTLEIWLSPSRTRGTRTILSFDGDGRGPQPFALQQHGAALSVRRHNIDDLGTDRTAVFDVDNVFRENQPVLVTVTLGKHETLVYLDGKLARTEEILGTSTHNFTGRLVVADSSRTSDGWPGEILGLATYARQLSPAQVARHYESWTRQQPAIAADEAPAALYLFNERAGSTVHNQLDPATDLAIAVRYAVLHPVAFLAPAREYRPTFEYWQDVSTNLVGFIPLGFCFAAYFSLVRGIRRPVLTAIVLGFLTSLTIETWQVFLPTRASGMTDLMTNTLGTVIGAMGCRWYFPPSLLGSTKPVSKHDGTSPETRREPALVTSDSVASS